MHPSSATGDTRYRRARPSGGRLAALPCAFLRRVEHIARRHAAGSHAVSEAEEPPLPPHHEIAATPDMLVWGTLAAATPPALTVDSGDTVTIHAVPAGGAPAFPPDAGAVPAVYRAAVEGVPQGPGAHFVNRPVFVRGAERGDTLQVEILAAEPNMDWGFVSVMPLLGTLPEEFTEYETIHPRIDRARKTCLLPWGTELPLDPFFGVIGT